MDTNLRNDDRSSFIDWYNGYFEVRFQLQKLGDGSGYAAADRITIINGAHSLIKHLMIKSAGKVVYDTDNLHNVTFVKIYWNIVTIIVDQLVKRLVVFGY